MGKKQSRAAEVLTAFEEVVYVPGSDTFEAAMIIAIGPDNYVGMRATINIAEFERINGLKPRALRAALRMKVARQERPE